MPKIEDVKMKHAVNGFIIEYDYLTPSDKGDEFSPMSHEYKKEVFTDQEQQKAMDRFMELGRPDVNRDSKDVTGTAHQSDHSE